jgi:hypothetical protein
MKEEKRLFSEFQLVVGVMLVSLSLLLWLSPGRIDMIDGQKRYEVARNLVLHGSPDLRERRLIEPSLSAPRYSSYALGASLAGLPLVWLGLQVGGEAHAQFLFSFTTPLFGAALAGLLVVAFRRLRLSASASALWSFVIVSATLVLPTTLSVFDQVQEATLLVAAAVVLLRARAPIAFAVAGLFAGLIVFFQTAYIVLVPAMALALVPFSEVRSRATWLPVLAWWGGLAIGPLLGAWYNVYRFGTISQIATSRGPLPMGNPLVGLAVLLLSPGKSVFLYSPAILLGLLGVERFWREQPLVARFAGVVIIAQLLFVSSLTFVGGDWCWGPRYLAVTIPLLMLAAPFGAARLRRSVCAALIGVSFAIQLLGISLDHHRFFFDRNLPARFWEDRSFYFEDSALFARPGEIADSFAWQREGPPRGLFPGPYPHLPTFTTFGPPSRALPFSHEWQRAFPGLYWPRPWPFWTRLYGTHERVPFVRYTELFLAATAVAGVSLLWFRLRAGSRGWRSESESR